jgi:hypothetical protein
MRRHGTAGVAASGLYTRLPVLAHWKFHSSELEVDGGAGAGSEMKIWDASMLRVRIWGIEYDDAFFYYMDAESLR